jgi:60 kDa SS-A/Ro ribonucleoprotein
MPKVCRIGTHLFQFAAACNELRGWGRGLRRAIGAWYTDKDAKDVAYQCAKYQSRDGWSHRDLLRLCHVKPVQFSPPKPDEPDRAKVLNWVVKGWPSVGETPHDRDALKTIWAFEKAKKATDAKEVAKLIADYNLPRECVPTQFLNELPVWDALLQKMPMTAMIRNLATMTRLGLIAPLSEAMKKVVAELGSVERLKKARVHPLSLLVALKTYAQGRGDKSDKTWVPVQKVVDALDDAFYLAFDAVEPTNKRWMLGLDVSGSMGAAICNSPVTCCEAATAISLVTTRIEPWTFTGRFNTGFQTCPFTAKTRLDEALRYTRDINGGGTDCSMPMLYATQNKIPVDVFVVITDSETYAGRAQPPQVLNEYRQRMGIPAKMIVVGMTSTGFTVADVNDPGSLDIVGMDTGVPTVMNQFVAG